MIARIWHGRTKAEHAEEYTDFLKNVAIPDYEQTEGFIRLTFLRRLEYDIAHFDLITFWENIEVIKNFAGQDYNRAKYYPEDKTYLLEFEEHVIHHEVFADLSS